ncbi:MAG: hypothetical protein ACKVT1_07285 [Dehalococcoidia bacterium]
MAVFIVPEPTFEESAAIRNFWTAHHREFLERYPEQFVAVREGEVIVAASDLDDLVAKIRHLRLDPRTDVDIEFITGGTGSLLL